LVDPLFTCNVQPLFNSSMTKNGSSQQSLRGNERPKAMLRVIEGCRARGRSFPADPALRGFHAIYRLGEVNHCPGCGRTHWYVGRLSAECGFCGTALALAETGMTGTGLFQRPHFDEAA
jgi:hypothetical protein